MVSSVSFPQVPDASRYFLTKEELDGYEVPPELSLISRDKDGAFVDHKAFLRQMAATRLRLQDGSLVSSDKIVVLSGSTAVGKSGSPALAFQQNTSPCILGIQIWAMSMHFCPEIAIQLISREHLLDLQEKCTMICGFLPVKDEQPLDEVEVLDGAFTSMEFNNVQGQTTSVLGKVGKTQFKTTQIAPFMELDGYQSLRCPAVLSPHDRRRQNPTHPLNLSLIHI